MSAFKNRLQAWRYLTEEGWNISRSAFYEHCKRGLVPRDSEGRFTKESLDRYAAKHLQPRPGSPQAKALSLQEQKLQADIERARAQAEIFRLKAEVERGNYIPRAEFEQALASRARILLADALGWARMFTDELITIAGGDPARAPEVLAFVETHIRKWFDRYAQAGEINLEQRETP